MDAPIFPDVLRAKQLTLLARVGVDPADSRAIAAAVKRLSDFYLKHPEKSTPWHEIWAQTAYLTYFMPLNWWRVAGVIRRGQQVNFFDGFEHYIDFGSGLGSVSCAFDAAGLSFKTGLCMERGLEAVAMHRELAEGSLTRLSWQTSGDAAGINHNTLAIFSYSFTELSQLPSWVANCDGLMMIEPSTRDDARRLQALRSSLMEQGWYVWGPCTHAMDCPLLVSGERDWCHDRFLWDQPNWLKAIEDHLPMKNGTLPCAWMMFKKTPPPTSGYARARITGDMQEFKGYAKQLVCRSDRREFLSWQKKIFKKYPQMNRGELVTIQRDIPMKGQELRLENISDVVIEPH